MEQSLELPPSNPVQPDSGKEGYRARRINAEDAFLVDTAYEKAGQIFRHEINIESFAAPQGNYDSTMVAKDKHIVDELHKIFEEKYVDNPELRDMKKLADIFEAMIADQVNRSAWFGHNAELIASSEYDDIVNGVDGVLHFKNPGSSDYIALGVDITFSRKSIESKLRHVKDVIREGKMARLKYFELPDGSYKGELRDIPNIIVGADAGTVIQMSKQWTDPLGEKYISKHWMQAQLMDMATMQCDHFSEYAKEVGNKKAEERYVYMSEKIKRIKALREKLAGRKLPEDRDLVFKSMKEHLG